MNSKVRIATRFGDIVLKMRPDLAPQHVNNFLELVDSHFYDQTLFHRVVPGFVIQGGDPNSRLEDRRLHGTGGSNKTLKAEFTQVTHSRGMVSMARSQDPNSASSQFFIVVDDSPHMDGQYSIFAETIEGIEVVDEICQERLDSRDNPIEPISMNVTRFDLDIQEEAAA